MPHAFYAIRFNMKAGKIFVLGSPRDKQRSSGIIEPNGKSPNQIGLYGNGDQKK